MTPVPAQPGAVVIPAAAQPSPAPPTDEAGGNAGFHRWAGEFARTAGPDRQPTLVAQGLALAQSRRARMERLMRENPEQAIAESLSFSEWGALPPEVQAVVEKPFSVTADYHYYPVCAAEGQPLPPNTPDHIANIDMGEGRSLDVYVYGQNRDLMSKRQLPMQGIELGNQAALRDGACQQLTGQDLAVARTLFSGGQIDETNSYVTGTPVGANAVEAVIGGTLRVFSDPEEFAQFTARISRLNSLPGPAAATSLLAMPATTDATSVISTTGAINWGTFETLATAQASTWTEAAKKLFLIRVNFSDKLAEPVTQAAAANEINGPSSAMIRSMSYGKTWIDGTVSANLYTLPQTSTYYYNAGAGLNDELLRDARNKFRNTKSGGDAAINIGPVSANTDGDGLGLGDYHIVAVFFSSIGMSGGGITYAGLAGGGNLWVQNANYTSLYTHEWGHNYGLGHASSWDTTNGSVVGTGTSTEYGDVFDVLGAGPAPQGHYQPQGKVKLNWLTASQWSDATASGSNTYRVYREDDASTTGNPRGVRVTKAATVGSEEYYWIGYKPAFTDNPHLLRGAYLTWQQPGETRCWLLDTTPNSAAGKTDAPVDIGRTYADTTANVFITPLACGGSGSDAYLDVRVNLGPYPGNHAPTGTINVPTTVTARSQANFTVTATDADGDALAYSWNVLDGVINDSSASFSHVWAVGGTYPLSVTVSDMKGGTVTLTTTITVTDPIDTWTQQSIASTDYLYDVVWGKGRFVAAMWYGAVHTSWDGESWTYVGDPPAFDMQPRLAFGNNGFVMAGKKDGVAEAQICYSADARIWKAATFPAGIAQIQEVAFGNGKFLAVADGGKVLSSVDGSTWSLTTVGGTPNFRHITWDGSAWAAVAMNAAQSFAEVVWTSPDGVTWTQRSALGFTTERIYGFGGVMYALGFYSGVTYSNLFKYSTDHGVNWTVVTTPGTTLWSTYRMAVADDGTFLVTGQPLSEPGQPSQPRALLVSADGIHWTLSTANSGNSAVGNAIGLVFGAGRFLSVDNSQVVRKSGAFYPSNTPPVPVFTLNPATAPARQVVDLAASASDANGDSLVYAWDFGSPFPIFDGARIAPVFDFGGSYPVTLRVSDSHGGLATLSYTLTITDPARTFTQRTSTTTNNLTAIAANSSIAVAVGWAGAILTSTDGVTWTPRSVPEYAVNISFQSATWDGSKFIIVGYDYNFTQPANWQGVIYTSADGITWTRRYGTTNRNDQLYSVASDGTGAVAVGNYGSVITSANGTTGWSAVTISGLSTTSLSGVAWNGSVYAMVGCVGSNGTAKVLTSTNRVNWLDKSAGVGVESWQDLRKIAWMNDRFVASGWYSLLRVSTDSAQTFSTTRSVIEQTPAMVYGDGIYFAAGINHISISPNVDEDVDVLSRDGVTWYSSAAPTTTSRNSAAFFKHTFITVGDSGSIWQSGNTSTASTVATLTGLTLSSGTLSPTFATGILDYTASVANATATITLTPTVTDATATITVNGTSVASGASSGAITLAAGANVITTVVTAQDGTTTKSYTVTVTRAPSAIATLSGLALSSGTLSPAFSAATLAYTASVSNATTSMTLTPTVTDATATIKVNGTTVASGASSGALALAVGTNPITTVVTAQDGSTTKTYTVTVTRAPSAIATLSGL
ncbi:MAG: cadherin-like beta sandwich domain-containing protein, partial [Verrucomicrobiota bacterium]